MAESSRQTEWVLQILTQQHTHTHTPHSSCVNPPQSVYTISCPNDTFLWHKVNFVDFDDFVDFIDSTPMG